MKLYTNICTPFHHLLLRHDAHFGSIRSTFQELYHYTLYQHPQSWFRPERLSYVKA